MKRPIVLDVTRLASRFVNATPNGIDRVDAAYASHFLRDGSNAAGLLLYPWGPRSVRRESAARILDVIEKRWGNQELIGNDRILGRIAAWLAGGVGADTQLPERRLSADRPGGLWTAFPAMAGAYAAGGGRPDRAIPPDAAYLNVSQFPLWVPRYFRWARRRPDIMVVPVIHDLLPLQHPEFFRTGEPARHYRRLAFVAARANGAIVTTAETKRALLDVLRQQGRHDLPVHVAPLPVDPRFHAPAERDETLSVRPYFVQCGTIEPRKNHMLMLQVWLTLIERYGPATPRLILVGRRGWKNRAILDLLCDERLRGFVLEIGDLSTQSLKRLIDNARGVLVPSFAEGFGLPVIEARAAGAPLIVSDIPVFREIGGPAARYVSPYDAAAWLASIEAMAGVPFTSRTAWQGSPTWPDYFAGIEAFLSGLPLTRP